MLGRQKATLRGTGEPQLAEGGGAGVVACRAQRPGVEACSMAGAEHLRMSFPLPLNNGAAAETSKKSPFLFQCPSNMLAIKKRCLKESQPSLLKVKSLSHVQPFATPWTIDHLCPWDSPGKNAGVGCHFLLQGIFPTQGSNPGLLHCRQTLYPLSHQGSPM